MRYQKWNKDGDCKLSCYSHDKSKPHLVKDSNCPSIPIWSSDVEDIVFSDLWSLPYKTPDESDENDNKLDILSELTSNEAKLVRKIKRLYELYGESDDDLLLDTIRENNEILSSLRDEIAREKEFGVISARRKNIEQDILETKTLWEFMTFEEKRIFIKNIINKIIIKDNCISIDYDI